MSLLKRALGSESRATLSNPPEWLVTALTGGSTFAGQAVSVNSSLGLAPFWRGVNILSNAFATSPCKVYRERPDGSRELAKGTRAYELLHDKPNANMAADEYWAIVEQHIECWGNHFAWKERGGDGLIANLWPLDPSRVAVARAPGGALTYVVDGDTENALTDVDILHIRALSLDGLVGYSTVQLAKENIAAQLARQQFKGSFWQNDATPGVTLIHPNKLNPEAVDRLRALWDNRHKGPGRARQTAVLADNVAVKQMTMPLNDAQFIEQERWGATEIALRLGLPPYMLAGDSGGDSLTYSTTEGLSLDLLKWTVGPRFVRVQNAVSLDRDIMPPSYFSKFDPGGIMRATTTERYRAWAVAPHLTINEMREMDDLPPIDGGDVLNKSALQPQPQQDSGQASDEPEEGDDE